MKIDDTQEGDTAGTAGDVLDMASESDADDSLVAPEVETWILTFIPSLQCPAVPQAKYLYPGFSSFTTLLPSFMEFNESFMSHWS